MVTLAFFAALDHKPLMLHLKDLTYRLGPRLLIDSASVALPPNAKVGLVGRNGTGKTTLFRIIMGELATESGGVGLPKNVRIGAVSQEAPGGPETLLEVVLAADVERVSLLAEAETTEDPMRRADIEMRLVDIGAYSAEARAASILHGLGFDAEQQRRPCSSFSGGWRMRVALAAVLFTEPDLLLLDEPTNYLDLEGTLWLYDYLGRYPHTVLVISHDRELLDTCVDHILHLDQAKLTLYRGGYSSFDRQRIEKMTLLGKMKDKQEAERKHLQAFVDRFKAKASKAKQAQSRVKRLEKLAPISAIVDSQVLPFHFPEPTREMSPPLYTFDGAAVGYGEKPILKGLNLSIQPDDRIALLGPNGNGKSTFCKLLAAKLNPMAGEVRRSSRVEVAYFAQHQVDELRLGETPVQHIAPLMPDSTEARIRARAAQMGFPASKADTKVAQLSGGEKARLMLGIATFKGPHLLILDEPTNHLDIDSRAALMEAINDYPGAVMLVSHDRFLIEACADRLWLVEGGTIKPFDGDLDEYRAKVLGGPSKPARRDSSPAYPAPPPFGASETKKPARGKLEKRLKEIEGEIGRLDSLRQRIDKALAQADIFVKEPEKAGRLSSDRAALDEKIARIEDEWLEVSTALSEA
jgi:ATP-binding cassette subfamily F protein 3